MNPPVVPPHPPRALRALHPVWALNGLVLVAAIAIYLGPVHALGPLARVGGSQFPWPLIAVLFAAAELCVVHLHFRRGALSFSLGEIPLVFGLVFCGASGVLLACLLGSAVILRWFRKLPPIKLVFNLATFALATGIGLLVVHAIAASGAPQSPRTWLAVIAATECGDLVNVLLIACAIFLTERQMPLSTIGNMLATDGAVTLNNTSLGLCGVVMIALDPKALPLLIIPLGTLFVAYRAYLSEQERQKQLEFVHEAGRTLSGTGEIAWLLETMLERSLHAFRAEAAEVILFGRGDEPARRTARGPGERHEVMAPLDAGLAEAARGLVDGRPGARVLGPELRESGLVEHGVTQGMIAPLRGEEDLLGAILLAGRLGVATPFDRDDLMLLDTLAANASVALQHDRLEHAASHDSLTGLLSRAAFNDHVAASLAAEPLAVALLFVDLDNFKTVNDTLGHARGDDLLVTVGEKLRACVRGDDVVARLGGDEFAILVRAPDLVETAATSVAQRIIASCRIEVSGDGVSVIVHASVGVAVCRHEGASGEELINAADLAMYEAKTGGRGRYVVFGGDDATLAA